MTSAISPRVGLVAERSTRSCTAALTTPGPLTPMLMTQSGSPTPWKAPAMNGLSLTALPKMTSLAQPKPSWSRVRSAVSIRTCPSAAMASMLIPAAVEPTLTDPQTRLVVEKTSGRTSIRRRSPAVHPFWTIAENPPTRSTPTSSATASSVRATARYPSALCAAATEAIGLTAIRRLTIGMPYRPSTSRQTALSRPA